MHKFTKFIGSIQSENSVEVKAPSAGNKKNNTSDQYRLGYTDFSGIPCVSAQNNTARIVPQPGQGEYQNMII